MFFLDFWWRFDFESELIDKLMLFGLFVGPQRADMFGLEFFITRKTILEFAKAIIVHRA
jgi:hypothetical protein